MSPIGPGPQVLAGMHCLLNEAKAIGTGLTAQTRPEHFEGKKVEHSVSWSQPDWAAEDTRWRQKNTKSSRQKTAEDSWSKDHKRGSVASRLRFTWAPENIDFLHFACWIPQNKAESLHFKPHSLCNCNLKIKNHASVQNPINDLTIISWDAEYVSP